ncbi:MAG: VanZ family protein [Candidatus Glassbacteria bacterium]
MSESNDRPGTVRDRLLRWLPAVLWMGLIFTLSSFSYSGFVARVFRHQDKLFHLVEFGILGVLFARAMRWTGAGSRGRYWSALALVALFGALDEFHQSFVPHRLPDWTDFAADCLGALIFIQVWAAVHGESLFRTPARGAESD